MEIAHKTENRDIVNFWLLWVCANIIGYVIGRALPYFLFLIYYTLCEPDTPPHLFTDIELIITSLISGLAIGCSLGFGQWIVLKKWIPNCKDWITNSIMGWLFGLPVTRWLLGNFFGLDNYIQAITIGAIIGFTGWFVLKKYFNHSIWWILIWVFLGIFTNNFSIFLGEFQPLLDGLIGAVIGVFSGILMAILISKSRKKPTLA